MTRYLRTTLAFLTLGILANGFLISGAFAQYTVYGCTVMCRTHEELKCGANIDPDACPFEGWLIEMGNPSNKYYDLSYEIYPCFEWTNVTPGRYRVVARSQPTSGGIYQSRYGCITVIEVLNEDVYGANPQVVYIPW